MINLIFDLIFWYFVGWIVIEVLKAVFFMAKFKKEVRDAVDAEIEKIENKIKVVYYEIVEQNDHKTVLMYDDENNFIAQGQTKEQVNEIAIKRFPQFSLVTVKEKVKEGVV